MKTTPTRAARAAASTAAGRRSAESAPSARIAPPIGKSRAAGESGDADPVHEHPRRREPMEAEQRCHDRERAPDENGVTRPAGGLPRCVSATAQAVAIPAPDRDAGEVDPTADEDLLASPTKCEERSEG